MHYNAYIFRNHHVGDLLDIGIRLMQWVTRWKTTLSFGSSTKRVCFVRRDHPPTNNEMAGLTPMKFNIGGGSSTKPPMGRPGIGSANGIGHGETDVLLGSTQGRARMGDDGSNSSVCGILFRVVLTLLVVGYIVMSTVLLWRIEAAIRPVDEVGRTNRLDVRSSSIASLVPLKQGSRASPPPPRLPRPPPMAQLAESTNYGNKMVDAVCRRVWIPANHSIVEFELLTEDTSEVQSLLETSTYRHVLLRIVGETFVTHIMTNRPVKMDCDSRLCIRYRANVTTTMNLVNKGPLTMDVPDCQFIVDN